MCYGGGKTAVISVHAWSKLFVHCLSETPVRIKRFVVESHEMVKRWSEEVALLKQEMANFIMYYMDLISAITSKIKVLEEKLECEHLYFTLLAYLLFKKTCYTIVI